jgi:REP-associated tyrosine transposase
MTTRPFEIGAIVVMPDHVHCIWRLPEGDGDFATRWRLVKRYFSVGFDAVVNRRDEKRIWQRRYWEHLIRDAEDWRRHMDYIHYNPVKHGYVSAPALWRSSSFRRAVEDGLYPADWGASTPPAGIDDIDFE